MWIMVVAKMFPARRTSVQRWVLTSAAFHGMLARLDVDPLVAGKKYEHLRRVLLRFFSWQGTPDAEGAVDDTLDRIARKLDAGHAIEDISAFAYGVARVVRLERQRQAAAAPTTTDNGLAASAAAPEDERSELRDACLQRCLAELSPDDRQFILAYYVGTGRERIEGRARLAAALDVSDNALRSRARRLRDRLRVQAAELLEQYDDAEAQWGSDTNSRSETVPYGNVRRRGDEPGLYR
jgi:DNA-directed RNA polymerase specialized sigma24 family protein